MFNFPKIVKRHLSHLPKDDYPVLNTFLFVSTWLHFVLDQGETSMRSVFRRLNVRGINVNISTFSKASKKRDPQVFYQLFLQLKDQLRKQSKALKELKMFPLDSTIVTLTSKLLWHQGFHQVKLFSGLNLSIGEPDGVLIHFGQGHDNKYGDETIDANPENGLSIMDRGFCKLKRIVELMAKESRFFLLRINNKITLEMLSDDQFLIGKGKDQVKARVVNFCDLETQCEFRLVTNLTGPDEEGFSNEEVGDFYRQRWQIELLWKFLKMHLKLDRLITKNTNGIEIQIYACLIGYVLLQLVEIPKEFGSKLLDRLRYMQAFMCENISYVHWFKRIVLSC